MRILIDIIHPADVNFYKNAVLELSKKGHDITFTILRRGKLPQIMKNEYPQYEQILIGKHYKSFLGKIVGILRRELDFFFLFSKRKFDVVSCFGFYPGMFSRLFGIPAVHFHDDKEYKLNFWLSVACSTKFISFFPYEGRKVKAVNSYKELAYLYPGKIREDTSILKTLGLSKKRYVYVREVAGISLNYANKKDIDYSKSFYMIRKRGFKIVYDSENGAKQYEHTIVLSHPITMEQMIALKKNALFIITSGDTVLREASFLGIPVIYTSSRKMEVNEKLFKQGLFQVGTDENEVLALCAKMINPAKKKDNFKKAIKYCKQCEDMSKIIQRELEC